MKDKISIILPIFNVGDHLRGGIDSLVNQTIGNENLEIIMVNDCSTDGSDKTDTPWTPWRPSTIQSRQTMPRWHSAGSGESSSTGERSRNPIRHTRTTLKRNIPARPLKPKTSSRFRISSGTTLSKGSYTERPLR